MTKNNKGNKFFNNKKSMTQNATIILVAVLFIVAMGSIVWWIQRIPATSSTTTTTTTTGQSAPTVACPSGSSTNMKQQYEDTAASTATFAANVNSFAVYQKGGQAQTFVSLANTSSTADAYSGATSLECNTLNPVVYKVFAVEQAKGDSTVYGYTSAVGYIKPNKDAEDITMAGSTVFVDFLGKRVDSLKATVKNKANQDFYLNSTSANTGGVGLDLFPTCCTGYFPLNATFTNRSGQSGLDIGSDGYFDLEINVKTNNTRNVIGSTDPRTGKPVKVLRNDKFQVVNPGITGAVEHSLRTLVAIDADSGDWQEPVVSGGAITKIDKAKLAPDDQTVLSSYEYFYTVNPLKDTDTTFEWYMLSKAGVNPTMDPKWRFCAEGLYSSSDDTGSIKIGCFDDSSGNTELTTASAGTTGLYRHEFVIDII